MDVVLLLKSLIMGVVEGVTEFLPISSTGHLILAGDLINFWPDQKEKRDVYEIFIQLGAILAVVWEYRAKLAQTFAGATRPGRDRNLLLAVIVAFIPAAILGKLLSETIKAHLFKPVPVALAFIIGGLLILWAEKRQHRVRIQDVDNITWKDGLKVGFAQCLALIPGTSRSGATIIGGLFLGLSRKAATEFSFFLGIPTLTAASVYSMWKLRHVLDMADFGVFAVGFVAAAISAFIAVRALLRFIATHTFIAFAWYRIAFGIIVLLTAYTGVVHWAE
ncbi:undecaprenyl-diphosphate phosphatase [Amantichitinum ursilacus]|uniref:Undecaprenyl-diphosphatase n=1 Tax=Amantichitinum ursilacus TaxID=857265 RepID=A0A0N0XGS3_9NEIS|nr:undecaprenyl-diphosphate phosphatase [Amantichitinum ursilacus]KPC50441.1 Undecaprenyl-diphosphatase [Amantichitinum ursilacus]